MQTFSDKQKELLKLCHGDASNVMAFGGRRSGKTYALLSDIVAACYQYQGLRALVARSHLNHILASIGEQTLPDVLKYYPPESFKRREFYVEFFNGSRINLAGYDDKERIEKMLGQEYAIIYSNECSTISYNAIVLSQSSLAQRVPGFENKMYYDMNPPPPTHWTYKLFIEKTDPKSKDSSQVDDPSDYVALQINPKHNPLLTEKYIKRLEALPDRERRRYLLGEFVKLEGAIYDDFDPLKHSIDISDLPQMDYFTVGIDNTGTNFAAILIGWAGDKVYILDEYYAYRETIQQFDATIQYKWRQYGYVAYPDPAAAQLNDYIWNAAKADNAVEPGINFIRQKISENNLLMVRENGQIMTPNLLAEMDSYRYDDKGRIIKEYDHGLDALRYGTYSHARYGGSIIVS